jgi:hypothetical protein
MRNGLSINLITWFLFYILLGYGTTSTSASKRRSSTPGTTFLASSLTWWAIASD